MCIPGINGEGELRGQPANTGSPRKMAAKTECMCVCSFSSLPAALMGRCVCHDGVCACVCIVHVYMGGCLRLA